METTSISTARRALTEVPAARQVLITRLLFFIEGFGITAWAPLVPLLKERAGLSEGHLGALLLGLGLGAALAMMVIGRIYTRLGSRTTLVFSVMLLCGPLPVLAHATDLAVITLALLAFGLGIGAIDGAANIWAVSVDQRSKRSLMPSFHGCFSVGGVLSPTFMSVLLGLGVSATLAALAVCGVSFVAVSYCAPSLPVRGEYTRSKTVAMPKGTVILLGLIFLVVMLAEAVMRDWSGVFLTTNRAVPAHMAGFGYVAFATCMMLFRFVGERITRTLGMYWTVAGGGVCAALGIAVALLLPSWQVALLGFALVGAGCSNIVPLVFTAAGKQHTMPLATAIPAVATVGYLGILGGPAVIGLIAEYANLSVALAALGVLLAGILFGANIMKD